MPIFIFCVALAVMIIGLFLPLGIPRRSLRMGFMLLQCCLLALWVIIGWNGVAPWWWEYNGGCAAHGGAFEGACGYAGVVDDVMATAVTAAVLTLVSGLVLRWMGRGPARGERE